MRRNGNAQLRRGSRKRVEVIGPAGFRHRKTAQKQTFGRDTWQIAFGSTKTVLRNGELVQVPAS